MNVAVALALLVAVPEFSGESAPGERAGAATERSLGGARAESSPALDDLRTELLRGDAYELAQLLRPVQIDRWIERGEPGLPRVTAEEYAAIREQRRMLPEDHPLVHRLVAGPHLEARPLGEDVVISPQHGGHSALSVDLLLPIVRDGTAALRPVRAPLDGASASELVERLRAASPDEQTDCTDVLVEDDLGRWRPGCAPDTCSGTCTLVGKGSERWVDVFGCVCATTDEAADAEVGA